MTKLLAFCAFCRYCFNQNLLTDKLGDATFVTEGFNNWKKATERFDCHQTSGLHREAVRDVEAT